METLERAVLRDECRVWKPSKCPRRLLMSFHRSQPPSGNMDTGYSETGEHDTGYRDTGSNQTGKHDTGYRDTGIQGTVRQENMMHVTGIQGTVRQGNMIQDTGYIYRDTQENWNPKKYGYVSVLGCMEHGYMDTVTQGCGYTGK